MMKMAPFSRNRVLLWALIATCSASQAALGQTKRFAEVAVQFQKASELGAVLVAARFRCPVTASEPCHSLARSLAAEFEEALRGSGSLSVLTLADQVRVAHAGGMLEIDVQDDRVTPLLGAIAGAEYVTGDLKRDGGRWKLSLKLTHPKDRRVLARASLVIPNELVGGKPTAPVRDPSGPYLAGIGGVTYPSCKECPIPQYTVAAYRERIRGEVLVLVTVNTNGQIEAARVIKSLPGGLTEAALEAVKKWEMAPAHSSEGLAVASRAIVEVSFKLQIPWNEPIHTQTLPPPKCVSCPSPDPYKDGDALVRLRIDSKGVPKDVLVVSASDRSLIARAEKTVKGWRFEPILGKNGKPTDTEVVIEVVFRAKDNP